MLSSDIASSVAVWAMARVPPYQLAMKNVQLGIRSVMNVIQRDISSQIDTGVVSGWSQLKDMVCSVGMTGLVKKQEEAHLPPTQPRQNATPS